MLPDLRFVFGALITLALMGMVAVGLFVSTRLSLQANVGPLEASRTSVFTDSIEWNQFYDAGSVRRFVGLSPRGEARETAVAPPEHRTEPQTGAPSAIAVTPGDLPIADRLAPAAATASTVTVSPRRRDGPTPSPRPRCPSPLREITCRRARRRRKHGEGARPQTRRGRDDRRSDAGDPSPGAPSLAEHRPPATTPVAEAQQDRAAAVAVETENGSDQEPWDTTSAVKDGPETAGRATDGPTATLPSPPAAEIAVPLPVTLPKPRPPTATPPTAASPQPGRVARQDRSATAGSPKDDAGEARQPVVEIEPARPRASTPRARALASRQRPARRCSFRSRTRRNRRRGSRSSVPTFRMRRRSRARFSSDRISASRPTCEAGRLHRARLRRSLSHRRRSHPRQFAPQPMPPALPQPGYGPAYGSR